MSELSFWIEDDADVGHKVVIEQSLAPTRFVFPLLPPWGVEALPPAVSHLLANSLLQSLQRYSQWLLDAGMPSGTDWDGLLPDAPPPHPAAPQGDASYADHDAADDGGRTGRLVQFPGPRPSDAGGHA